MYIQSVVRARNLYTHNAAEGSQGWTRKCTLAGGTRELVQNPVYKRPNPPSPLGAGFTNSHPSEDTSESHGLEKGGARRRHTGFCSTHAALLRPTGTALRLK